MNESFYLHHSMSKLASLCETWPHWSWLRQGQVQREKKEDASLQLSWQSLSHNSSHPFNSSHFSPVATILWSWHLEAKSSHFSPVTMPRLMSPHCHPKTLSITITVLKCRLGCWCNHFFHPNSICKGKLWKVWDSPAVNKMWSLDTKGWKRVAGWEHLIWIISSSRRQFSLPCQMDGDLSCQCWISMATLPGHFHARCAQ